MEVSEEALVARPALDFPALRLEEASTKTPEPEMALRVRVVH